MPDKNLPGSGPGASGQIGGPGQQGQTLPGAADEEFGSFTLRGKFITIATEIEKWWKYIRAMATGGEFATVSGGGDNQAVDRYDTVAGGYSNYAEGPYATVVGGRENQLGGAYSTVGGYNNNVSVLGGTVFGRDHLMHTNGAYGAIPGGRSNEVSAADAIAIGNEAVADKPGQLAHAATAFAAAGDAQATRLVLRIQTTNATTTSLLVAGTNNIVLPDNSAYAFRAIIVARNTGANEAAGYVVQGIIRRDTGAATTTLVGAVTTTVLGEDDATWSATAIAGAGSGVLAFRVAGAAGKTINWVATVTLAEVTV